MAVEDPVVQDAIDAGNTELEELVIINPEDVDAMGDAMAIQISSLCPIPVVHLVIV